MNFNTVEQINFKQHQKPSDWLFPTNVKVSYFYGISWKYDTNNICPIVVINLGFEKGRPSVKKKFHIEEIKRQHELCHLMLYMEFSST